MSNRLAPRLVSLVLAVAATFAALAGLDATATSAYGQAVAASTPVQQVVVVAPRAPRS